MFVRESRGIANSADAQSSAKSFLSRHGYGVSAVVLVVATTGQALNQRWASPDFWVHLAAEREFSSSLLHPNNPLVVGSHHDPYLSPYTFALAIAAKLTGAKPVSVLAVAGVVNLALLLIAIRVFVRRVSPAVFAPLLVLVFMLTAWGLSPWRWSGFFDLNSLGTVVPLASTFASAIGLLTVAAVCDVLRGARMWKLGLAGVGMALTLLCHPVTAIWIALVGVAFVVSETTVRNRKRTFAVIAVAVAALVLASIWPYYSIVQLLARSSAFDRSNAAMYHAIVQRTFLAVPGFVVLGVRFARRRRDPLALAALFNVIVYAAGYATNHDAFGRVLPGILLMAQVAMGVWVAERLAGLTALNVDVHQVIAATAAVVGVGLLGSAGGVVRFVPRAFVPTSYAHRPELASLVAPYNGLDNLISRNDVAVASRALAPGVAASSGKVIAPPAPAPFVSDAKRRNGAVRSLLSPQTSTAAFEALVAHYDVDWFVLTPADARNLQQRISDGELRLDMTTPTFRVYRVVAGSP
jgi:hypothetical protein